MTAILSVISISLLVAFRFSSAQGQFAQVATLYEAVNPFGPSLYTENYQPNLSTKNFDNRAQSICITGVWLLYENANYNKNGDAVVEYLFGPQNSTKQHCFVLRNLKLQLTSIRNAGSQADYRSDTITFYANEYFQGEEEYTFRDLPNLSLANNIKSLIITGSSSWTVYDLPNYLGNSRCINPPPSDVYKPAFIYNLKNIDIPNNSIKSIRKGCH